MAKTADRTRGSRLLARCFPVGCTVFLIRGATGRINGAAKLIKAAYPQASAVAAFSRWTSTSASRSRRAPVIDCQASEPAASGRGADDARDGAFLAAGPRFRRNRFLIGGPGIRVAASRKFSMPHSE
ncbi:MULTISPECIES: hypothetical protein [Amycolatopsis]|uniref:Uncharacterized protein n=1 Tax=Amycolatopsis dendrobii TaxID=2760662 RepID=A0A7W3W1I0_9PSEU|nr:MULTISPECIES: hypothetical protein [Amycolatopsis]MBB1157098.1 hypothetical protein [Amycolatopsis dendrobii]UKD59508.1 hypothetical protein L3Q65_23220 [Amycolatopsis sp. FU40]